MTPSAILLSIGTYANASGNLRRYPHDLLPNFLCLVSKSRCEHAILARSLLTTEPGAGRSGHHELVVEGQGSLALARVCATKACELQVHPR